MGIIFQNRILIYALLGGLIIQIDWVRCYCLADLEKKASSASNSKKQWEDQRR